MYVADPTAPVTGKALPDYLKPQTVYYRYSADFVINNGTLSQYNGKGGSVVIPDGVTAIGYGVFHDCTALKSVTIPASVTEIGGTAFAGCTGLTSVTIPASGTEIGFRAFGDCTGLTSMTLPASVTELGSYLFSGCTNLKTVTLPEHLTELGGYVFYECTGLTSAVIPNTVTEIGSMTFYGCTGLTSVNVPASVTSIGFRAFSDCTGLQYAVIPASVTEIGNYAFTGCTHLTAIVFGGSEAQWANLAANTGIGDNVTVICNAKATDPVAISGQPADVSGRVNDAVTLSVRTTGPAVGYQWYVKKAGESSFTAWNKKTTASVSTPIYQSWNGAQFYCTVKDGSGSTVTSDTVKLTVTSAGPAITAQPANVSGAVNDTATFSVKATGAGLTYQWYIKKAGESDFTAWNKKTSASVSTPIYASWHGAQFYCTVKDGSGKTVKSDTAILTVK